NEDRAFGNVVQADRGAATPARVGGTGRQHRFYREGQHAQEGTCGEDIPAERHLRSLPADSGAWNRVARGTLRREVAISQGVSQRPHTRTARGGRESREGAT